MNVEVRWWSLLKINITKRVEFYYVDMDLVKDCPRYAEGSHISLAAYYRIFLGNLLPLKIHKVLYLDCDLVVVGSIEKALEYRFEDFCSSLCRGYVEW